MRFATIFVGALLGSTVSAQTIPSLVSLNSGVDSQGRAWGKARVQPPPGEKLIVARRAFSGEESGGPVSGVRTMRKVYRDAAGRTRVERLVEGAEPLLIELNDPAAGEMYILDVSRKTAHHVKYSPSARLTIQPIIGPGKAAAVNGVVPRVTEEALGSGTIEGIAAEGQRFTTVIAPGSERTEEIWTSPGLWLTLRRTIHDPRDGDTIFELHNIKLDEPDAELFRPPAGYRVVNAPAVFDLEIGTAPGGAQPDGERVYKIGNGVTQPSAISRGEPRYTDEARAKGISGSVVVECVVGVDGIPRDIRVIQSLDAGLDENAVEAISQWRFRPGQLNGKPVAVRATIQTSFKLGGPPGPLPTFQVGTPPGGKQFPKVSRP